MRLELDIPNRQTLIYSSENVNSLYLIYVKFVHYANSFTSGLAATPEFRDYKALSTRKTQLIKSLLDL